MMCTAPECCPAPAPFVPPGAYRGRRVGRAAPTDQQVGHAPSRRPFVPSPWPASLAAGASAAAEAQRPAPYQPGLLRVCNDPDNMPLSNQKEEGFEQKIAELIAKDWNSKLEYAWWPVRRGYFRDPQRAVLRSSPSRRRRGLDMAGTTKPYYRSGYVFLTRKDSKLARHQVPGRSPAQEAADRRQRCSTRTSRQPPTMALSRYGVVGNLSRLSRVVQRRGPARRHRERRGERQRGRGDRVGAARRLLRQAVQGAAQDHAAGRAGLARPTSPSASTSRWPCGAATRSCGTAWSGPEGEGPEIQAILKEYGIPMFPVTAAGGDDDDDDDGPPKPAAAPAPADTSRTARKD